jgi:hypothetical protein
MDPLTGVVSRLELDRASTAADEGESPVEAPPAELDAESMALGECLHVRFDFGGAPGLNQAIDHVGLDRVDALRLRIGGRAFG